MTVSCLERLPRELRDQIYALVLTAPGDLDLRTGNNGVGRICDRTLHHPRPSAPSIRFPMWTVLGNITSAHMWLREDARDCLSFNQIQYVSRVFFQETHGLEFRYNLIIFEDCKGQSAGQRCRQVVNQIATRRYANDFKASVRSTNLCSQISPDSKDSMKLIEFCRLYPGASIRLHNPLWSQAQPGFVLLGISYGAAVRKKQEPLNNLLHKLGMLPERQTDDPIPALSSDWVPDNFRLYPFEEQLDQAIFLEACAQAFVLREEECSSWIPVAEKWFKDGI
jgi:hypothetical protein